jgi:spermidine synthase
LLLGINFRKWWVTDVACAALIIRLLVISFVYMQFYSNPEGIRNLVRNFYGHQRVIEYDVGTDNEYRSLIHGTITHGIQFMSPEKRSLPTAYFAMTSGMGIAIKQLPVGPRRVGIIGLGAGTMATYARKGDQYKYYEINPQVEEIARKEFSFLSDSRGMVEIKLGDGRLLLEQEPNQQFDLLAVDAFSGDSIPIHLLTIEAINLYFSHLKPDGILAFHVSNLYLDLTQVIDKAGRALGKHTLVIVNQEDEKQKIFQAEWVLMVSNPAVLATPEIRKAGRKIESRPDLRLWTDDYSNLFQILQ